MALSYGPNTGLLVNGAAGEEHYAALMAQWRGFDLLVQCTVIDRDLDAPPGSPADGDSYIIGSTPSGAWAGHARKIARWSGVLGAWQIITPRNGWRACPQDELVNLMFITSDWYQREAPIGAAVNNQAGTSYTFGVADTLGRVTRFTAATPITATVPANAATAIVIGSVMTMRQVGDGQVTVSPSGGVTINTPTGFVAKSARKGSVLMLHKVGTDEWDLTGDLPVT